MGRLRSATFRGSRDILALRRESINLTKSSPEVDCSTRGGVAGGGVTGRNSSRQSALSAGGVVITREGGGQERFTGSIVRSVRVGDLSGLSAMDGGSRRGGGPASHLGTGGNGNDTQIIRCGGGGMRNGEGAKGFSCNAFCKSKGTKNEILRLENIQSTPNISKF